MIRWNKTILDEILLASSRSEHRVICDSPASAKRLRMALYHRRKHRPDLKNQISISVKDHALTIRSVTDPIELIERT